MLEFITDHLQDCPLTYLLVFGAVLFEAVFPVLPGETVIILASVLASREHLLIWFVLLSGAAGSFVGDNLSCLLGNQLGHAAARRLFRSETSKSRLRWAQDILHRRGQARNARSG